MYISNTFLGEKIKKPIIYHCDGSWFQIKCDSDTPNTIWHGIGYRKMTYLRGLKSDKKRKKFRNVQLYSYKHY